MIAVRVRFGAETIVALVSTWLLWLRDDGVVYGFGFDFAVRGILKVLKSAFTDTREPLFSTQSAGVPA